MTFAKLEEIRISKGLAKWQFAWLIGLRPQGKIRTPLRRYLNTSYAQLAVGRRKISTEIIAAADRLEKMSAAEILKELKKFQ